MTHSINAPFRYEPSGDCDGEQFGTDHFVMDADGNEIACAPNEATGRLLAAATDLLAELRKIEWIATEISGLRACPSCHYIQPIGTNGTGQAKAEHGRNCTLAAAIAKATGAPTP